MPSNKIYYFDCKALGEGARLLLAYGQEGFEDIRVTEKEWPSLKPTMPFQTMPVLEVDGVKYSQSLAIVRYLGRKYGLSGKTLEEDLLIDQNMYFFNDIRLAAYGVSLLPDEDLKAKQKKDLHENYLPKALKKLNEIFNENNGHLGIGRLTWADFMFAGTYDRVKFLLEIPDIDEQYPAFKKLQDKVLSIPQVKAYHEKAPKSIW
ncbi:unnamed protein product, partial [Brenthis ino]